MVAFCCRFESALPTLCRSSFHLSKPSSICIHHLFLSVSICGCFCFVVIFTDRDRRFDIGLPVPYNFAIRHESASPILALLLHSHLSSLSTYWSRSSHSCNPSCFLLNHLQERVGHESENFHYHIQYNCGSDNSHGVCLVPTDIVGANAGPRRRGDQRTLRYIHRNNSGGYRRRGSSIDKCWLVMVVGLGNNDEQKHLGFCT